MPCVDVSKTRTQLTLNFEPGLTEQFRTFRDYLAYRVQVQPKPAKVIAGDMDMSPSLLSRKLSPGDTDTQRFNVDDLENYMRATGDTSPIDYLAAKYCGNTQDRQSRALGRVELLASELERTLSELKKAG